MAPDTTAKVKMVLAKSYSAQAAGTIARPLGVIAARPRGAGRGVDWLAGSGHAPIIGHRQSRLGPVARGPQVVDSENLLGQPRNF